MQYVFLMRSRSDCKKYVTRPFLFLLLIYMRFLTIFYAKTMGLSFIADVVREME